MDNFTFIVRIIKLVTNTLLILFILFQLPFYLIIFWVEFIYLIILMVIRVYNGENFRWVDSVTLNFPENFSSLVYIKIYFYTPRYTAFYVLNNILNLKVKKFKFKNLIIFILVRIFTYLTGIPLFVLNLWKFWIVIGRHAWLYYDNMQFGLDFIHTHQKFFK